MSGGSSIEFASLSDPLYATDEHKWVPSHSYWVRKEEVNGKTRTVHWIKCMLEKGAVSSANDLKTSLEDGGMTLEIKAKRPVLSLIPPPITMKSLMPFGVRTKMIKTG